MFCDAPVMTARASGVGSGTGMRGTISWALMSQTRRVGRPPSQPAQRSQVLAWALWDCGSTGFNAIVITFVFAVYLTGTVGADLPGDTSAAGWLGRAMAAGGLAVAVLAPATGVWVEAPRRRRAALGVLTGLTVALTAAMSLIRDDHRYLWPALVLLACAAATSELATVPYNAMLRQLSTPQNSGRVSGFGWAMGYFGSVTLLLVVYAGFIAGEGDRRGLLGLPVADGLNVRAAMLLTAAWFLLFALPVLITVPSPPDDGHRARTGFLGAYRRLAAELAGEWRRDRNVVYYLIASAVFRDGLAGVFAFGAVLGVTVYGVSEADVLLFGVCASVIAAIGAVLGGLVDDRVGSKPVIIGSLAAMIATGLTLLNLSGAAAFWICGLLLCMFIGPTQSSARTLMLRMATLGKEGVAFGLYTTTGRAMSFLSPWMFFTFIDLFGTDRAGMAGLCVVLVAGLVAMLAVRVPRRAG
ncbi:major facilitator superfamily permease [Mycolicibacterium thermoresistibile]|uniref:Major facilitator superfamily permease n=2 Tax=Mycolicibacterium thermoresistibile TaxID=1797 RepID=A0A117ILP1_MYCTH|nr:major facilitator superfamily permease [Mycolicibacterium thermoresistibile]